MTVNTWDPIQRATTSTEGSVDINKLRVLIAEHLQVDVRRVTIISAAIWGLTGSIVLN